MTATDCTQSTTCSWRTRTGISRTWTEELYASYHNLQIFQSHVENYVSITNLHFPLPKSTKKAKPKLENICCENNFSSQQPDIEFNTEHDCQLEQEPDTLYHPHTYHQNCKMTKSKFDNFHSLDTNPNRVQRVMGKKVRNVVLDSIERYTLLPPLYKF